MITDRKADILDVMLISPELREEDRAELTAASGMTPYFALERSFEGTPDCRVGLDEHGRYLCIGGVVPWTGGRGVIWLLATPAILDQRVTFLRHSKAWVERLQRQYPILCNCVDERNTVHIEWLKWLGFTFINRHPEYGAERIPFLEFVRIAPVV